jgi:cytochrome o ubiquinol oxidase subunit 2
VVALDWKWLFIYPDLGFATVNELAAPIDTPIDFQITSSSVMNSLSIPALAGQIYAMPGMETKLHAVINKPGEYEGLSANYSGAGFSGMHFIFHGMSGSDFDHWAGSIKSGAGQLDRTAYLQLEQPSENEPVRRFASATPNLYSAIVNRCVQPGKMCASDMMRVDANGGMGLAGVRNVLALEYDKTGRRGGDPVPANTRFVQAVCQPARASHASSPIGPLAESAGPGARVALR